MSLIVSCSLCIKITFENYFTQLLLNPEMMKASPALAHYVYDFLENKAYSKGKGDFARKVRMFCTVRNFGAFIHDYIKQTR